MPRIEDLIGNADAFPVLAERDFFNHAGASPMPAVVRDALKDYADRFSTGAYLNFDLGPPVETFRKTAAAVLNAGADEIAIVKDTSEAISQVALGLDWQPGDRVVVNDSEYPANFYPWMAAAERFGVELVRVAEETDAEGHAFVSAEKLREACDHPKTRLLALSHVQWGTGQCYDLEPLGRFCRERGILFSVDVIQSLGVVPIDVKRCHIDFAQAGGHKWMMGPMGAGVLYVRRELIERVRPTTVGWFNFRDPLAWEEIDYTLREGALRYEYGTPALPSIVGAAASLNLLHELGIDNVCARVRSLGDRLIAGLEKLDYAIVTPPQYDRGGAVCFVPRKGEAKQVFETLAKTHQTELAFRCGRIRFSPHFYNTEEQVDRLVERLADLQGA